MQYKWLAFFHRDFAAVKESLYGAGYLSEFICVFTLEMFDFSLHYKLLRTGNFLPVCNHQNTEICAEAYDQGKGLHSHVDETTPWVSYVGHPTSVYKWISLKGHHVIKFVSD